MKLLTDLDVSGKRIFVRGIYKLSEFEFTKSFILH